MKYFPYCEFEIKSSKDPMTVYSLIKNITDTEKSVHSVLSMKYLNESQMEFHGKVSIDRFSITPNTNSRDSFIPLIDGTIIQDEKGSVIKIKIKPFNILKWFCLTWLGLCILIFLFGLFLLISSGNLAAIIFAVFAFASERVMTFLFLNAQMESCRDTLIKLLE